MKILTKLLLSIMLLMLVACKNNVPTSSAITSTNDSLLNNEKVASPVSRDVSLINLIATPGKYNNKKIRAIGYLHLEFEGNGLYLHKDDYDYAIDKNAIWVETNEKHSEVGKLSKFSNHYVILEGTSDSNMRGHMGVMSGSIKDITRLELWPTSQAK